jgi:hypothetical protein
LPAASFARRQTGTAHLNPAVVLQPEPEGELNGATNVDVTIAVLRADDARQQSRWRAP